MACRRAPAAGGGPNAFFSPGRRMLRQRWGSSVTCPAPVAILFTAQFVFLLSRGTCFLTWRHTALQSRVHVRRASVPTLRAAPLASEAVRLPRWLHERRKGDAEAEGGNFQSARNRYDSALQLLIEAGRPISDEAAGIHMRIGGACHEQGFLKDALGAYDKAYEVLETQGQLRSIAAAGVHMKRGVVLESGKGKRREASHEYMRARDILSAQGALNSSKGVMLLNRMGTLYASSGMAEDALHVYAEALQALEAEGALDTPDATGLLANIGRMQAASGRLEDSLKTYLQARERLQASSRLASAEGAALLADVGDLYARKGRLPDALNAYSEARDALDSIGLLGSKAGARALVNAGEMQEKLGDSDAALQSFNAAASIYRVLIGGRGNLHTNERDEVHKLLLKLGSENLRLGNVDVGFEQLGTSLRHSSDRRLLWNDDGIALIIAMGDAFYKKRRYLDALRQYDRAKEAFQTRGKVQADIFKDSEQGIALESKIACTLSMKGDSPEDMNSAEWHKEQDFVYERLHGGKAPREQKNRVEKVVQKKRERRETKLRIAALLHRREEREMMSRMREEAMNKKHLERSGGRASTSASDD